MINLIDNVIKNCGEHGKIEVSLKIVNGKKVIAIKNTGEYIKEEDLEKIIERFYRADDSRSRQTGGYGLGLAIVKSIVENHKGKIEVHNVDKGVEFRIIFSL